MFIPKAESAPKLGKSAYEQNVSNLPQFTKTPIPEDLTVGFGPFTCHYVAKMSNCLSTKFHCNPTVQSYSTGFQSFCPNRGKLLKQRFGQP